MKRINYIFLIVIFIMSGCSSNNQAEDRNSTMLHNFNEPFRFPFEVNEVRTEIEIYDGAVLQQYVFYYKNKQTAQEIRYILSKVIDEPEKVSEKGKQRVVLENGEEAFYEEDETSQSIWWESENGFLPALFIISMEILIS